MPHLYEYGITDSQFPIVAVRSMFPPQTRIALPRTRLPRNPCHPDGDLIYGCDVCDTDSIIKKSRTTLILRCSSDHLDNALPLFHVPSSVNRLNPCVAFIPKQGNWKTPTSSTFIIIISPHPVSPPPNPPPRTLAKISSPQIAGTAMMASTPASTPTPTPLPISNPQSGGATAPSSGAPGSGAAPIATPAFRLFISRLSDSVNRSLSNRRPWSELLDRSAFSRPDSLSDASFRIRKNFAYFRVNYIAVLAAVLALSLITNPFSLLVLLGLLAAWCLLYLFRPADPPLVLFGRTFSDRETLGSLVLLSVFVIFLTSVGSLLMSALTVGVAIICAHGAFRVPEDLFLDDQEPGGAAAGLLSFLGGTAASATAAAGSAVAARV